MLKISVLLIENQYLQFKTIRRRLTELKTAEYTVYPELLSGDADLQEFKRFMNQVRIALNGRYSKVRCGEALMEVIKYVKSKDPDLLIIDHKLVGNEDAGTGIDLAIGLYEAGCIQPVLFLSRTPESKRSVIKGLDGYINSMDWLYKGYSDHELLDESYFEDKVHKTIEKLLIKVKEKGEKESASFLLSGLFVDENVGIVLGHRKVERFKLAIQKITNLTDAEAAAVRDFKSRKWTNPDRDLINIFFNVVLTDIINRNEK